MSRFAGKRITDSAVSPVVGVMLMLVVTIIIAAVVSTFAGSAVNSQQKIPQATIQGKFSVGSGMEITHMGGDALATSDLVFTVRNSPVFGQNLEQITAQEIAKSLIQDGRGRPLDYGGGSTNVTSFVSGDTLYIKSGNLGCEIFQPRIYAGTQHVNAGPLEKEYFEELCFNNPRSVGKTFFLDISDKKGNLISRCEVTITP